MNSHIENDLRNAPISFTIGDLRSLADYLDSLGYVKLSDNQNYPDMVFYCPACDKMVKNTKCNIVDSNWRKVIL